jgi:hypothetical protein
MLKAANKMPFDHFKPAMAFHTYIHTYIMIYLVTLASSALAGFHEGRVLQNT